MPTKESSELKTLKILPETHKKLSGLGGKGETFDTIIQRLLAQNKAFEDAVNKLPKEDKERVIKKMEGNWEKFL